jgi:hypothetical protein
MGSLQEECNAAMTLVFDQFAREDLVTFYKSAAEEIVFSDPNWNADFGDAYSLNIVKTAQKRDIKCRIFYFKDSEVLKSLDGDENISLKLAYPIAKVRIQIKKDDFGWLKDAKAFYVLGDKFVKESDWRGIGMLAQIDRYEIILRKNQ